MNVPILWIFSLFLFVLFCELNFVKIKKTQKGTRKYWNFWNFWENKLKKVFSNLDSARMIDFPVNHIKSTIFDDYNGIYQNTKPPFPVDLNYNICK